MFSKITTVSALLVVGTALMGCPGEKEQNGGNDGGGGGGGPKVTSFSKLGGADLSDPTNVKANTPSGTPISANISTSSSSHTQLVQPVLGLPVSNKTVAGGYDGGAGNRQFYGVTTNANGAEAFASQDVSNYVGAGSGTAWNADLTTSAPSSAMMFGSNYGLVIGEKGQAPQHKVGSGTINLDPGAGTFSGSMGPVSLSGNFDGSKMNGEAILTGYSNTKGTINGAVGYDNVSQTTKGAGVFAGSDGDDTAFAGAFE